MATDDHVGSVVWLKGVADGSFTPITLAAGLGRVADAQAADFDGDGDLDLVAAEFGWLKIGRILLLDNRTIDPSRPVFVPSKIDPRHGTIHVPVADLNGDGRPDFVALLSQEHETVVAYLNTGDHRFRPEVIHDARHPAFGSTGIQLIDLDGDGDLDVLLTNGDSMDAQVLRPYHGVQWLENRGSFPFVCHPLTSLYGVHRAVAADLDLDGDLDIVAVCFLPGDFYRQLSRERELDAMVVLEQTARADLFATPSKPRPATTPPAISATSMATGRSMSSRPTSCFGMGTRSSTINPILIGSCSERIWDGLAPQNPRAA